MYAHVYIGSLYVLMRQTREDVVYMIEHEYEITCNEYEYSVVHYYMYVLMSIMYKYISIVDIVL